VASNASALDLFDIEKAYTQFSHLRSNFNNWEQKRHESNLCR